MTQLTLKNSRIAVIGLGYVGLPLAVEFGKKRPTLGFDVNKTRIKELTAGFDRTLECELSELSSAIHLELSSDESVLDHCDVFIVTVPTPVDHANRPDLTPLVKASETIGRHLNLGNVVVYESTVFPGATEEVCVPVLEETSGMAYNQDFYCGYSPERINPGDKTNTLATIIKVVSGSTPEVAQAIEEMYAEIVLAGTHCTSSIKVAEASKVIENTQRDLNIAFVNELSVLFHRLDIDTTEVLEAAGTKWNFLAFRPGMVGGHCIGVDPYYLTHKAEQVGYIPQLISAGRRMNESMAKFAARNIIRMIAQSGCEITKSRLLICGVTFKENCPDIRNSKVFGIIHECKVWGIHVDIYDPWADPIEVFEETGINPLAELEGGFHAVIVAVGHDQFRAWSVSSVVSLFKKTADGVLGDLKGLYPKDELLSTGLKVFRF